MGPWCLVIVTVSGHSQLCKEIHRYISEGAFRYPGSYSWVNIEGDTHRDRKAGSFLPADFFFYVDYGFADLFYPGNLDEFQR